MSKIKLDRETAMELSDDAVYTESDTSYRHGSYETYVVPYLGSHYEFTVSVHHSEGWDDFDEIEAYEVFPHEVTVIEWRTKP